MIFEAKIVNIFFRIIVFPKYIYYSWFMYNMKLNKSLLAARLFCLNVVLERFFALDSLVSTVVEGIPSWRRVDFWISLASCQCDFCKTKSQNYFFVLLFFQSIFINHVMCTIRSLPNHFWQRDFCVLDIDLGRISAG